MKNTYDTTRAKPCRECGVMTRRRNRKTRDPICRECSIEIAEANMRMLAAHRGSAYENWRAAMLKAFSD